MHPVVHQKLARLRERVVAWGLGLLFPGAHCSVSTYRRHLPVEAFSEVGPEVGFVFQGPVLDAELLYQRLAVYRQIFPRSAIVLSTWRQAASADLIARLQGLNIKLVESDKPSVSGILNVNFQIVSTAAGLKLLQDNAVAAGIPLKTVCKLRTDYCPLYPENIFRTLAFFEQQPAFRGRIWGVDINTRAELPFSFADVFQCGPLEEMLAYWTTTDLDQRSLSADAFMKELHAEAPGAHRLSRMVDLQPPEMFLMRRYLMHRKVKFNPVSLSDYHAILAKYFGIFDADQIGFAFDKYSPIKVQDEPILLNGKRFVSQPQWLAWCQMYGASATQPAIWPTISN